MTWHIQRQSDSEIVMRKALIEGTKKISSIPKKKDQGSRYKMVDVCASNSIPYLG